jgi:hypothetical protein
MRFVDSDTIVFTTPSAAYPNSRDQRVTLRRSAITHLRVDYNREDADAYPTELTFHVVGGEAYYATLRPHQKAVDVEAWWLGLGHVNFAGEFIHDYVLLREKK